MANPVPPVAPHATTAGAMKHDNGSSGYRKETSLSMICFKAVSGKAIAAGPLNSFSQTELPAAGILDGEVRTNEL